MTIPKPITLDGKEIDPCSLFLVNVKKADSYSKEQRRIYNSVYKAVKKSLSHSDCEPVPLMTLPLTGTEIYCSTYGCRRLTPEETLYGNQCIDCQGKQKPDPTIRVKFK